MKKYSFVFLLLIMVACSKSDPEPVLGNCTLTKINSSQGGFSLEYDPQQRLSAVRYDDGEVLTMEYDEKNHLVKISERTGIYQAVVYSSSGLPIKAVEYRLVNGKYVAQANYTAFEHNGSQLSRVTYYIDNALDSQDEFEYDNKGNLSRVVISGMMGEGSHRHFMQLGTVQLTHDNYKNPLFFSDMTINALLSDYFNYMTMSPNNVLTMERRMDVGMSSYSMSYEYNKEGYPVKAKMTGQGADSNDNLVYTYSCK